MSIKVLGISCSPREGGNSDTLLRQALAGAKSIGVDVEYLRLSRLNISPCTSCGACYATGQCPIADDFQIVLPKILSSERLIFATPVYFMSVCAQAKILIDRCQCLWARKYLLKQPGRQTENPRLAMVIAVGGTKGKKMFESIRLTMKYYLDALDTGYFANLFAGNFEEAGKIVDNEEAMEQAYRLGAELAGAKAAFPEKSIDVEITG